MRLVAVLHKVKRYISRLLVQMLHAVFLYSQAYPHEGWLWSNPFAALKKDVWAGYDIH